MAVQVSHCGGAVVGWGPTSVTAYLPWPRVLLRHWILSASWRVVWSSKLISWPGLVALPAVARAWPVRPVDNVPVRPCFGFLSGLEKILKV